MVAPIGCSSGCLAADAPSMTEATITARVQLDTFRHRLDTGQRRAGEGDAAPRASLRGHLKGVEAPAGRRDPGLVPVHRLKAREKAAGSEKPTR